MPGTPSRQLPRDGDVVVSKQSARIEHEIIIVPSEEAGSFRSVTEALTRARALASARHVDAWLTEDLCHFNKIAAHRHDRG